MSTYNFALYTDLQVYW